MSGQPAFLGASATLADVTAAIGDLKTADAIAQTRAKGTAAARDDRRLALVVRMAELKAYVQKVADADMENGAALIQSAGMNVKRTAVCTPRVFAITQGPVSGTVRVVAPKAADRAAYDWEWSTDGGKTWQIAPSTLRATTQRAGLVPGSTVWCRYRAVTKAGEADWSEPTSFLTR